MVATGQFIEGGARRDDHLQILAGPFCGEVEADPLAFRGALEAAPTEAQVDVLARSGLAA